MGEGRESRGRWLFFKQQQVPAPWPDFSPHHTKPSGCWQVPCEGGQRAQTTHTPAPPAPRGPSPEQSGLHRPAPLPTVWFLLLARARTEHHAGENRVLALPKAAGSRDIRAEGEAQHRPRELSCTSIPEGAHPSTSPAAP